MFSFIHISDIHYNDDYTGTRLSHLRELTGKTPTEQFEYGMKYIVERHPEVDFYIITGDLAHEGSKAEYSHIRSLVEKSTQGKPYYAVLGNHDTDFFWEGWLKTARQERYDYSIIDPKSGLKIIAVDSRGGAYGSGILSVKQQNWLREELRDNMRSILLLHHTPHIGGEEYLIYQTQNASEIFDAVHFSNLLGIFSGHTHIRFESMFGEIPAHTAPSITFGLETNETSMTLTDKTGYNYCVYENGAITVQNIDIPGTGASMRFTYDELL